ncbi:tetratricopeptide repeat protein, partial [Thermodesulfobacteriota bacterium]
EDTEYAFAWASLAWTHIIDTFLNFSNSPAASLVQAAELAQKALSLESNLPHARTALSFIYLIKGQHEEAVYEGRTALSLSPNDATSHMILAQTLCFSGNFKEAISLAERAMRLSPNVPAWYLAILGLSYCMEEKYEESLLAYRKLLEKSKIGEITPMWAHIGLASVYSQLDQEEQARFHIAEILKLDPEFSLDSARNIMRFKEVSHQDRIIDSLMSAGLK